jgi:hypothetical protein
LLVFIHLSPLVAKKTDLNNDKNSPFTDVLHQEVVLLLVKRQDVEPRDWTVFLGLDSDWVSNVLVTLSRLSFGDILANSSQDLDSCEGVSGGRGGKVTGTGACRGN